MSSNIVLVGEVEFSLKDKILTAKLVNIWADKD